VDDLLGADNRTQAGGHLADTGPGLVFRTGEPLVGPLDPRTPSNELGNAVIDEGLKFACLLPLISRNRVLGVLALGRKQDIPLRRIMSIF
jgi:hypothetical protein